MKCKRINFPGFVELIHCDLDKWNKCVTNFTSCLKSSTCLKGSKTCFTSGETSKLVFPL